MGRNEDGWKARSQVASQDQNGLQTDGGDEGKGIRQTDDIVFEDPKGSDKGGEVGAREEKPERMEPDQVPTDSLPELYTGPVDDDFETPVPGEARERVIKLLTRLRELRQQSEESLREKQALYDQLLRRQAEFDNFRKRSERERLETYARARAEVFADLLPVLDNFERALAHGATDEGKLAEGLVHGLELVYRQFRDLLEKCGLEQVTTVGEKFDPDLHEAVLTEQTTAVEENTVVEELERGYRLGSRVLRPAKVKVAVRK